MLREYGSVQLSNTPFSGRNLSINSQLIMCVCVLGYRHLRDHQEYNKYSEEVPSSVTVDAH